MKYQVIDLLSNYKGEIIADNPTEVFELINNYSDLEYVYIVDEYSDAWTMAWNGDVISCN